MQASWGMRIKTDLWVSNDTIVDEIVPLKYVWTVVDHLQGNVNGRKSSRGVEAEATKTRDKHES